MFRKLKGCLAMIATIAFLLGCCKTADWIADQARRTAGFDSIDMQNELVKEQYMCSDPVECMDVSYGTQDIQKTCDYIENKALCTITEIIGEGGEG